MATRFRPTQAQQRHDVTAVDMLRLRSEPRFDVVALLYSITNRVRLRIKGGTNDGEPVPSLVPLWNGANWLEREAYDMFGITFEGNRDLRRIYMPPDYQSFPLRKDFYLADDAARSPGGGVRPMERTESPSNVPATALVRRTPD